MRFPLVWTDGFPSVGLAVLPHENIHTAVALLITLALSPTMLSNAGGAMTESDSGAKSTTDIVGGPKGFRTGYLFWLCDTERNQVSTLKAVTTSIDIRSI